MEAAALAEPGNALTSELHLRLAAALGPDIGVACIGVDGDPASLYAIELRSVRNAIPRRQREFAAGRAAAREAMLRVGLAQAPIPMADDRSPVWPDNVVGSIAHTSSTCVAIAGLRTRAQALGIDIEEDRAMDLALWNQICTPRELIAIAQRPPARQGHWVTRFFCAKEAFYKWQYRQTGRMLEFSDVEIVFNDDQLSFQVWLLTPKARYQSPAAPQILHEGRMLATHGVVVAWLSGLPKPPLTLCEACSNS